MQTLLIEMTKRAAFIEMSVMQTHQRWIRSLRKLKIFPYETALSFSINTFRDESAHRDCLHFILIMLKEFLLFKQEKKSQIQAMNFSHKSHQQKSTLNFSFFNP